ncbi:MAG: response regulator, partial [Deltaproteobacteria bacterium]|nr:response regulator [Deltaproteobacteria bacterium]
MSIPLGGRAILLVEDDRALQLALAESLSDAGFTVFTERDGDWALRTFAARPIDLAVIDVLLPGRGGVEVAEEIRRSDKGREIPIIMASGVVKAQKGRRELAEKVGTKAPLEWLDKPFEPSKLVAICQKLLKVTPDETDPETRRKRRERARLEAKSKDLSSIADLQEAKGVESESQVRFKGAALVRGNLRDAPFAEVLSQLHRWLATGALLLRNDPVKKIVYLKEGAPLFVRSNLLGECLGQVLVRERMINMSECEESLRRMQEGKRQQGTVLIEMGCISPANLSYALQLQQETKLFDLFTWPEGDYSFNPRAEPPQSLVAIEMTSARILHEGIQRTYDIDRAMAALGDSDALAVRHTDDPMDRFQDMGLEAEEAQLFAQIDGRRTVGELVAAAQLEGLTTDQAHRLLYSLKCANMIQFGLPTKTPPHGHTLPPPLPSRAPIGAGIAEVPVSIDIPPPPVDELPERALAEPELLLRQQIERLAARAQDL